MYSSFLLACQRVPEGLHLTSTRESEANRVVEWSICGQSMIQVQHAKYEPHLRQECRRQSFRGHINAMRGSVPSHVFKSMKIQRVFGLMLKEIPGW